MKLESLRRKGLSLVVSMLLALEACGGGGTAPTSASTPAATVTTPAPALVSASYRLVTNAGPITGATVSVTAGSEPARTGVTDAEGRVSFVDLPALSRRVSIRAEGFDSWEFEQSGASAATLVLLRAALAWTLGPMAVLGAEVSSVSADRRTAFVTLDVAVLRSGAGAVETLTAADFAMTGDGCDTLVGRVVCLADASGKPSGGYLIDGSPRQFALLAPAPRSSYAVAFAAELGSVTSTFDWTRSRVLLRDFFAALRTPDSASLSTYYRDGDALRSDVLGPLVSDGATYAAAIGRIEARTGTRTPPRSAIAELVQTAFGSSSRRSPGSTAHLVVYGPTYVEMDSGDRDATLQLMRDNGLRFSVIANAVGGAAGVHDLVARTRGLIVEADDDRQLPTLAPILDGLLAGTVPRYRMTFKLDSDRAGVFVSGGTVSGLVQVRFPDFKPGHVLEASFAAMIP